MNKTAVKETDLNATSPSSVKSPACSTDSHTPSDTAEPIAPKRQVSVKEYQSRKGSHHTERHAFIPSLASATITSSTDVQFEFMISERDHKCVALSDGLMTLEDIMERKRKYLSSAKADQVTLEEGGSGFDPYALPSSFLVLLSYV
jgi:hypothetical protein